MSAEYDNYYGDETRPLKDENQTTGELKALEWKIKALAVSVAVLFICVFGTLIFSIILEDSNIEDTKSDLEVQLQNGVWCAYQDQWSEGYSIITYDDLLLSSTNMNDPGIGIDIQSGKDQTLFQFVSIIFPRSVHSSTVRSVASFIQPHIRSKLRGYERYRISEQHCLHLPQRQQGH